jgi:transcriptional regulator with XRE-family HTH domain
VSAGYTSQEQFAIKHNINRTQYAKYEKGKDIQFSSILRVLEALEMSLKDFSAKVLKTCAGTKIVADPFPGRRPPWCPSVDHFYPLPIELRCSSQQ